MSKIKPEEKAEFLGQIVDIFDDFLEEKGIRIPSSDEEMKADGVCEEDNAARIYGSDYGMLQSQIEDLMIGYGVMEV